MSLTSYQAALSRDVYVTSIYYTNLVTNFKMAEDEGFEPPREFPHLSVFKTDPFNQTWVIFQNNGASYRTRTCNQPIMSRGL